MEQKNEYCRGTMDQSNISAESSPIDDNTQEIICITPYSPEEIHARTREKIRVTPTKVAKKEKKTTPMPQNTALSVTVPLSINDIHSQAQAMLKNIKTKIELRHGKTPQRLSLNYKKNKAVCSATSKKSSSGISAPIRVDSDRESSPEIMIIEEVTKIKKGILPKTIETSSPLQSKSLNSITVPSPHHEKESQTRKTKAEDPRILNLKKVSKLSTLSTIAKNTVVSITPPVKLGSTSNKKLQCPSPSRSSSQAKTSHTSKPFAASFINLSSSSRPSSVLVPGPSTSHSSWTPQRLLSDTPQKEKTDPLEIKPSPNRGVKRLLEVEDDTNIAKIAKMSLVKKDLLEAKEESLPKFEYLKVFKLILTDVWSCDKNMHLFDVSDLQVFSLFEALSEEAKALYVQLLKIKHQWRRVSTLKYDDILPDLLPAVKELVVQNFLEDSEESLIDLQIMLDLLKMNELKSLMQGFQLTVTGRKQTMINALISYGRNQCSIFPTAKGSPVKKNILSTITDRVKDMLGPCVRLQPVVADAFQRVCLLGTLPSCFTDENLSTGIYRIYQALRELTTYPNFQVQRATIIFKNKESLVKFHMSFKLLLEATKFTSEKNWNDAIRIAQEAWIMFKELQNDEEAREHDKQLPEFLRRFTAGDVLASVLNLGLDAMGRRKQYVIIVELLRDLLNQQIYKTRHRGIWYERLALVLQCHVKHNNEAAEVVIQAMTDAKVHLVSKVALAIRGEQILGRKTWKPKAELKQSLSEHSVSPVKEPLATKITAKYRGGQGQGLKLDYIHEGLDGDEVIVSSVEELAISYYKRKEGFTEGVHAEGTLILSLFGILFWDVIYDHYVPDAFLVKYQERPLDLSSSDFYKHRQNAIENRLAEILKWEDTEAQVFLQGMWEQHIGKLSVVSWKSFRDVQQAQDILLCIGMQTMAGICRRLCLEHGIARSGFPDILLWKPGLMKNCKFVEVKGPNDKLSSKQRVWIDYLMKIGAQVEVCYVETKSEKYLGGVTNGC